MLSNYFTRCIDAFLEDVPRTRYSHNAGYAAGWLRIVADHYAAVKRSIPKLGLSFDGVKPQLMKFKALQQFITEHEPIARLARHSAINSHGLAGRARAGAPRLHRHGSCVDRDDT